jgi:hypothetical protein
VAAWLLHTEIMREHLLVTTGPAGDLSWYLEEMPEPPVPTLEALAVHWWPLDPS